MATNHHKKRAKRASYIFSILAAFAIGITGAVALVSALPSLVTLSVPLLITLGAVVFLSGAFVEGKVFWNDLKTAFSRVFSFGPHHIHKSIRHFVENFILWRERKHLKGIKENPSKFDQIKLPEEIEKAVENKSHKNKGEAILKESLKKMKHAHSESSESKRNSEDHKHHEHDKHRGATKLLEIEHLYDEHTDGHKDKNKHKDKHKHSHEQKHWHDHNHGKHKHGDKKGHQHAHETGDNYDHDHHNDHESHNHHKSKKIPSLESLVKKYFTDKEIPLKNIRWLSLTLIKTAGIFEQLPQLTDAEKGSLEHQYGADKKELGKQLLKAQIKKCTDDKSITQNNLQLKSDLDALFIYIRNNHLTPSSSDNQLKKFTLEEIHYHLGAYLNLYFDVRSVLSKDETKKIKAPYDEKLKKRLFNLKFKQWRDEHPDGHVLELFSATYTKSKALHREIVFKILLNWIAKISAIAYGIAFGALTFNSLLFTFAFFGITSGIILPLIVIPLTAFTIIAFSFWMYTTLSNAVMENIFKTFLKSLTIFITPDKEFHEDLTLSEKWGSLTPGEAILHGVLSFLKIALLISLLAISIFVTIASAGTFFNANTIALSKIGEWTHKILITSPITSGINMAIIWCGAIPAYIIFLFQHLTEAISTIFKGILALINGVHDGAKAVWTNPSNALKTAGLGIFNFITSPTRVLATLIFTAFVGMVVIHFAAEGGINAEGIRDSHDSFANAVNSVTNTINNWFSTHISAPLLAGIMTFIDEFSADFPFLFTSHDHGHCHNQGHNKEHHHGGKQYTVLKEDILGPNPVHHHEHHAHEEGHTHSHEHGFSFKQIVDFLKWVGGKREVDLSDCREGIPVAQRESIHKSILGDWPHLDKSPVSTGRDRQAMGTSASQNDPRPIIH